MGVVKHRKSFSKEIMDVPSLETVKVQLNKAEQPDLTQSLRRLCSLQQGWTTWPLKVPCNPNYFMILRYCKDQDLLSSPECVMKLSVVLLLYKNQLCSTFFLLMDNYWKHSDLSIAYGIFGPIEIKTFSAKLLIVFCVEWKTNAL